MCMLECLQQSLEDLRRIEEEKPAAVDAKKVCLCLNHEVSHILWFCA